MMKFKIAVYVSFAFFLIGCGTVTRVSMEFDSETLLLQGTKTLQARIKPNGNQVDDVEVEIQAVIDGNPQTTTVAQFDGQGNPLITREGNTFTLIGNFTPIVAAVDGVGDSFSAKWNFRFSGGSLSHGDTKTYSFVAFPRNLSIETDSIRLEQGGEDVPTQIINGLDVLQPTVDQLFTLRFDITNNSSEGFEDALPITVTEINSGGSLPPNGFEKETFVTGGFDANETRSAVVHNLKFTQSGVFRQIRVQINRPNNPVLLEENPQGPDNLLDSDTVQPVEAT
ncbi:MAG: hypothetical protein AAF438_09950 [Pseudomonadota bacterium]